MSRTDTPRPLPSRQSSPGSTTSSTSLSGKGSPYAGMLNHLINMLIRWRLNDITGLDYPVEASLLQQHFISLGAKTLYHRGRPNILSTGLSVKDVLSLYHLVPQVKMQYFHQ